MSVRPEGFVRKESHPETLAALGARLRASGLSERGLTGCFGVSVAAQLGRALAGRTVPRSPPPPAALLAALFVAGDTVETAALARRLGDDLARLIELELVDDDAGGDRCRARCAIVPVGDGLIVCDRVDAPRSADLVPFPDDSSHHLVGALPRAAVGRWLDVGTGAGVALCAAPWRAVHAAGADINPRALAMARQSAALSGVPADLIEADLVPAVDALAGRWDLITFNAPIPAALAATDVPDDVDASSPVRWRSIAGGAEVLAGFATRAAAALADDDAEIILHSVLPAGGSPIPVGLGGRALTARYTPATCTPAFGVTWWWPRAPGPRARAVVGLELTAAAPHVRRAVALALPGSPFAPLAGTRDPG